MPQRPAKRGVISAQISQDPRACECGCIDCRKPWFVQRSACLAECHIPATWMAGTMQQMARAWNDAQPAVTPADTPTAAIEAA